MRVSIVLLNFLLICIFSIQAKEALVPLPSLDDFTKGVDGWGFGLGMSVEYEAAYEGSDEYGFEVDPAGAVQWRTGDHIFFWAGEALGWRGLISQNWLLEALVGVEEGREESDSKDGRLGGLGNGEESVEVVLQARHALEANWRYWLDARLVASENGNLGLFGMGRRFGDKIDGTGHEAALALVFHDSKFANKDFGINSEQSATSGLRQTNLSGGFRSIGFNYNYRQFIFQNWQILSEIVYEHYSSDIKKSPIARKSYEAEIGLGFVYVF